MAEEPNEYQVAVNKVNALLAELGYTIKVVTVPQLVKVRKTEEQKEKQPNE